MDAFENRAIYSQCQGVTKCQLTSLLQQPEERRSQLEDWDPLRGWAAVPGAPGEAPRGMFAASFPYSKHER